MRTIQSIPFAALGMGAAFTILWGVADPVAAYAEVKVVEADGYYIMGDGPEENPAVAKERARVAARRAAIEQAGICVESISEVEMSRLTGDEIRTISANVLEVQEAEVASEVLGSTTIQYHCHVKARVDTSDIMQQLHQERRQLEDAARQNREMEEQFARVHAELAELKARYKIATEAEKQEINREVRRNEDEFTAVQWNVKGRELNDKKDYHGAIECLQKAIELAPKCALPWSDMGYAYNDLGNYDKAIECYQKAIELDPKYANPWKHMGTSYYQMGNYEKAVECFRKAIQLDPDYESAKEGLALAQAKL